MCLLFVVCFSFLRFISREMCADRLRHGTSSTRPCNLFASHTCLQLVAYLFFPFHISWYLLIIILALLLLCCRSCSVVCFLGEMPSIKTPTVEFFQNPHRDGIVAAGSGLPPYSRAGQSFFAGRGACSSVFLLASPLLFSSLLHGRPGDSPSSCLFGLLAGIAGEETRTDWKR